MINFNSINKSLMKNMGSALVNMAMIASPLSTGAATNAYYAARKANYGRNNSYLIDEGLNSLRTGRWNNNLASKKDRTNIETATSADDLVLRKNVAVRELVVVDSHIKNRELFSKLIRPGVELVRIDSNSNGFDDLMNKLAAYEKLDAIHLFAHSQQGQVLLGNQLVAKTTIETSVEAFSRFNHTLKEGGELRVYNSELENFNTEGDNLEISTWKEARPSVSKVSINTEELSINKGDINAYPEEGSIARDASFFGSATFNMNNSITKNGAQSWDQTSGAYTLQARAGSGSPTYYQASPSGGYTGIYAYDGDSWKFSLSAGETFDLTGFSVLNNTAQITFYFKTDKGNSSDYVLGNTATGITIGSSANLDGITYFEIISKTNVRNGVGNDSVLNLYSISLGNVTAANAAPVIGGTTAGQGVNDNATITPFSIITVTDDGSSVSATITLDAAAKGALSGTGLTADGGGVYSISSTTPSDLQSKLRALTFTPTANRSATSETTTFTVVVSDGSKSDTDNTTTVISSAVGPTISAVSIPNSSMNVGDVVTATITVSSDTDNYTSGSGAVSGTIGGFSLGNLSRTNATTYTATFTVTEGGTDVAAGSSIPVSITLTDSGGKGGNTYTTPISQGSDAIDANSPTISNVSMPNTPLKVGDAITISIVAGETGLSLNSGTINGVAVTGFTDNLNNTYRATYTVVEGNTDRAAGDDIPVSFILTDAAGNNSSTYATAISQGSDAIDANSPTISSVSIPNSPAKVGDAITVTISAGETGLSLNSGTVNGVAVTGFTDNANNTYSATYTVTEGNADRAAGTDIPVSFILNDAAGNSSSTYATAVSQGSDAIDANSPTISSVSIPNSAAKVGDAITVTITAGETGLSLNSGEVNGVTVTGFTDNSDNTYSATYTVVEGNTDRAAGDNIPVAFILNDGAGNSSSTFVTAISQGSDAIDANSPASPVVSSPSSASRVNAASQIISGTHGEDGATINAYADSDNNGVADNSTSLGSAVVSGGAWSFSVNLSADTDNNFVVVAEDGAGNQSSAVDVSTITEDSTGPNITSLGLNNSNAFIEVNFNEGVYSTNGGSGALEASDLDVSISGGAATNPVITSLKKSDGTTDLTGGETIIRVNFTTTGVGDGGETITVNFADGSSVFDVAGNAAAATQSNNTRTLNDLVKPNVTGVSIAANNSYVDVTFNEAVYNDNCLGGALETSDFDLKITGGSASLNALTSVTKTDGNAASGGETSLRINFTLTGTPNGSETVEVDLQASEVFDQNGLVGDADQTSNNTVNLIAQPGITVTETSGSTSTTEAGGTDSFTVVLDAQPSSDVVLSVISGDTGEGTVSPATLTFTSANWNTPQTVTVTGVNDDIIDGTINYNITISVVDGSSDDNYDPVSDKTVNISNTDNDVAGFTVTQSSGSTATTEAGGTDSFTVVLDAEPSSNVVIDVTSGDTGEATISASSLTFTTANWDTPQTITVTGVDDDIIDGTQTFNITLSINDPNSDDNFDPLGDQTVSLDNTDDDVAGFTVTQSGGSTEVSESGTTDDFTVVLDAEPASNVVINVTSGDTGEATISAASLTFTTANWDNPQTITVTGTDDSDLDGSQTTTITLSIDTGSSDDDFDALGDQSVSVTTEDDDTPVISFSSTASSGVESVNSVNITVDNTLASLSTITVDYAVSGTATGSGTDYTLASGTLTFAANSTSETITIASIVNDEIVELDETVIITLSNPSNAILGTNTMHTYTITDDDEALITIANVTADEEDGTATVTLSLDKAVDGGFDVDVSTTDGTATTSDSDYTAVSSSTITFAGTAGETQSFDIVLGSDTKLEADETLTVAMSNLVPVTVNSADIDITDGATVTIVNDDTASVTIADVDGNEDDGAITLTATLDNLVDGGFTVDVSTVDGTATTADSDYTAVTSQTLTFTGTAGEIHTFTVTPTADAVAEGTEKLTVSMSNLAGTSLGVDISDEAIVTINEDDDGTAPSGYSITFDNALIGGGEITTSTFTFAGAEVGATYNYSLSSENGGLAVTGSGTISTATDQITLASLSGLNDGTLTLSVTLTDPANNVGTAVTATSTLDATRPEVPAVTSVSNDTGSSSSDGVTSDASPDVSGTAEANSTVEVFVGGNSVGTTTADASGNWTLAYSGGTDLSDGTISVTATATDAAGNTSIASVAVNVTIDTTAPNAPSVTSISNDTGVNGTDGKTNDNTLTISGTLPESNVTVEVFIDGISIGQAVMGLSTFSLDYSGTELEDGEYQITAKATDVAGNTGALSSVFNLTVDTTAPDAPTIDLDPIYDTGFSNSDNLTNSTSLKFTGVAEIGSDVEVFVNNVSQGVTAPDVITGEWFTIVSSLPQDQNVEVKAVATDYVGNTGAASEVLTVTIDNTVADPTFSPADNAVGVLPSANLVLTFDEEVRKSGNTISIRRSSDNSILESFDVSSDKVSVNGSVVTINPDNALLPAATEFYVVIGQGAFVDNAGNDYMGISNNTIWTFTTIDAAVVTAVSVPSAETYGIGDNLDFELTFSQEVTMTGSPTIDLTIGSATVTASLQGSVTSSTTATFRYTVKEGDLDADGISIGSAINLNGGTLKDAFDIDALADLNNVPSTAAILVDGVKPTPTITSDAGSLTNTAFTATFTYDEAVSGLELVDISVTNGTASNFTNVTAGTVWSATITPTADGETTITLNADVANDLAGNTSKAGNAVSTTFDGTAPTVTSITRAESDQIPTGTTTRSFTVVFSEDVTGVDVSDFEVVTTGSATASINTVSATDAKTYTVNVNGISGEGTIGLNAKDDDSILDAATNPLGGTFVGEIYTTNYVPTDISMSSSSIQENNAVGAEIGTFTTTDADAGDSFTYSLVSGTGDSDNGSFTMSADKLLAAEVFDFETKDSYSIRVKTEDGFGGSYEEALTISITNEGEAIIVITGDGVFDQTILGLSSTKNWTVENQGDVATEVRIISSSQGFSFTPGSVQVNPGETKNITAVFRPREARAYTGVVVFNFDITDNIKDNVVEIGLSGEGVIVTGTDNGQISEEQINVFPNPATTSITIDLSELHGLPVDIQMVNPTGVSKLEKAGYDKPELTIDITNFESGLYIIQFSNERSLVRKKVLIRR